jgi:signal transduction histidine kinase
MQTKYETEKKEHENQLLKAENELKKAEISKQKTQRNLLLIVAFVILTSLVMMYILYKQKARTNRIINLQKAELEKLNKTRNRFFSIISHDLKNSFTSLQMGTEMLSDLSDMDEEEISLIASELNKNVDNNFKLMENLLEWSRIQIGRIKHEPEELDTAELIRDIIELVKMKSEEKKLEIICEIQENSTVYADKNMMFSVIQNLLTNAIKFSDENGKIIIKTAEKGDKTEITISDNGRGITEQNLTKLFKVDEIVTTTGTGGEQGTGLGLILCKEFVEKNNGEISVESKIGKGTKVTITLRKFQQRNSQV